MSAPSGSGGAGAEPQPAPKRRVVDVGFLVIIVIGVAAAAATWLLHGPDRVVAVLGDDLWLFAENMPKVLAAVLLAAWLRLMLPREVIARHLGARSGWRGLIIATGAGIVVPGGPMTAFPLSIAFLAGGADRGTVVAFVISWLVLGMQRTIVWEIAFIDPEIVGLRYLVSLPVPILLGVLARRAHGVLDIAPGTER